MPRQTYFNPGCALTCQSASKTTAPAATIDPLRIE